MKPLPYSIPPSDSRVRALLAPSPRILYCANEAGELSLHSFEPDPVQIARTCIRELPLAIATVSNRILLGHDNGAMLFDAISLHPVRRLSIGTACHSCSSWGSSIALFGFINGTITALDIRIHKNPIVQNFKLQDAIRDISVTSDGFYTVSYGATLGYFDLRAAHGTIYDLRTEAHSCVSHASGLYVGMSDRVLSLEYDSDGQLRVLNANILPSLKPICPYGSDGCLSIYSGAKVGGYFVADEPFFGELIEGEEDADCVCWSKHPDGTELLFVASNCGIHRYNSPTPV